MNGLDLKLRVRRFFHARAACWLALTCLAVLVIGTHLIEARGQTNSPAPKSPPDKQQPDLTQMTIEDLLELKIETVYGASKFLQKVTEAPASVTIVSSEEIQRYGYRTLADILKSVRG